MSELTFEEYIQSQINEGYVAEDLTPLKCWNCEGVKFSEYDHDFMDYYQGNGINLLEYKLKCDECGECVGYWVTGNWQID
jgi:hypothetical protein